MTSTKKTATFSEEERSAMRERALELKAGKAGEQIVLAAIAKMPNPDRALVKRLHEIIKKTAPSLTPKTWYGMPAYADSSGKVVCFFQAASKFKYRYSTLGFQEAAKLDDGNLWPTSFAVMKIGPAEEAKIVALLRKALR